MSRQSKGKPNAPRRSARLSNKATEKSIKEKQLKKKKNQPKKKESTKKKKVKSSKSIKNDYNISKHFDKLMNENHCYVASYIILFHFI